MDRAASLIRIVSVSKNRPAAFGGRWIRAYLLLGLLAALVFIGSISASATTIGSARSNGGTVSLAGKVVTAVFYNPGTSVVAFFYIQEPHSFVGPAAPVGGMKVTAPPACPALKTGSEVTVDGTVRVDSGGECGILATTVTVTGTATVPPPVLVSEFDAVSGAYQLQPALARNATVSPAKMGIGLGVVGNRVRILGRVTWVKDDRTECCVDDGSYLRSGIGGPTIKGMRVIYSADHTCPAEFEPGYFIAEGLTGVIGTERAGVDMVPVPVLRVASSIVHVKPNGSDSSDGITWSTAKATVQAGIDTAAAMQPKGEVWVAAGDYEVSSYMSSTVTMADGVAVYGGFQGNETTRTRDWLTNITTLQGSWWTPVITSVNTGKLTRIDGFTITWGYAENGSGAHIENSSLVIANNHFTVNTQAGGGGAIYCSGGAPTITGNLIDDNDANLSTGLGGGIFCANSSAQITNNTISNNSCVNSGGGIYCLDGSPTISGNTISHNTSAGEGGGIYCTDGSPVITRNTIENNSAYEGGGIYCGSSQARIADNFVFDNDCPSGYGGGVYLATGTPSVTNNTVRCNSAPIGGNIYAGAGSPQFANNIVVSGSSGIWCADAVTPTLNCNNVFDNGADYVGIANTSGNVSVDPLFLPDGVHIASNSPCAGAGDNSKVLPGDTDIDGEPRTRPANGRVDIGADETDNCGWHLSVQTTPKWSPLGQSVSVDTVLKNDDGYTITGQTETFTIVEGTGSLTPGTDVTDEHGAAHTSLTSAVAGWVGVKVSVTDPCGGNLEYGLRVYFYPDNAPPVDIVFCLDSTGSMRSGSDHSPIPSVQGFLDEMSDTYGIQFRVGVVRFNEGDDGVPDYILNSQKRSLSEFTALSETVDWLSAYYGPDGGDDRELQLDALYWAAEDMEINSVSTHKYILLVTDNLFHENEGGSVVTKTQTIAKLESSGCPVFISLWDSSREPDYAALLVNGGMFDPANTSGTDHAGDYRYPFANLRNRILADRQ